MSKHRIALALCAVLLLSLFWAGSTEAQGQDGGGWSEPFRLSSDAGIASEASLVADQYGYVHAFWTEALFDDSQTIIQYARFDGGTWSAPNDIYLTSDTVAHLSPVVDQHGTLHIVWTAPIMGGNGAVYYMYALASNAMPAQSWSQPLRIDIPAGIVRFRVDSNGVFHILYVNRAEELGVYYVRSKDQGITWSEPVWLDPDILPAHTPDGLNFELDENNGLHAVWWYGGLEQGARPDWVRYTHSLDGGHTWSAPFLLDQYNEESDHRLTNASPKMIVQGQNVHVIWAAGSFPYRYHRFSSDAGLTWSAPVQIFGELHGQAFDGLAVDRSGRVHFLAQIRYPVGIYHAYWDQTRWSKPSLLYLIAQADSEEGFGDRVHAHHTVPVIRAGNQLVLTFTDPPADPNRRLFVTYRTLDDILPLETMPLPDPTATPVPMSGPTPGQPTPMPTQTVTVPLLESAEAQPMGRVPEPNLAIQVALIPTLLVLGATIIVQWLYKRKR